jgi:hypothetical protein
MFAAFCWPNIHRCNLQPRVHAPCQICLYVHVQYAGGRGSPEGWEPGEAIPPCCCLQIGDALLVYLLLMVQLIGAASQGIDLEGL